MNRVVRASSRCMPIRPSYWPVRGQPERTEPFTWIVEGVIAASWWPDPYVFDILADEGVKAVVNVCEFDNRKDVPRQFDYHFFHVPDYGVPSDSQIEQFLSLMDKHHAAKEPVVIHCVAGCGRTGQFIIAWCARRASSRKELIPSTGSVPVGNVALRQASRSSVPNGLRRNIAGRSPLAKLY